MLSMVIVALGWCSLLRVQPFHLVLCGVLTVAAANSGYGGVDRNLDEQEIREQRVDFYTKKIHNKKKRRSKSKVRSSNKEKM